MSARVLVVDDIPANVRLLDARLSAEYFEVLTANSGADALALMQSQVPDIVLLDVMMPGLDGFETCRRIKADPRIAHIPVVMVTALYDTASRVQGLEAGADDFLTKPVNDLALFARVRSLVRLKTMMDEWRLRVGTAEELGPPLAAAEGDGGERAKARILSVLPNSTAADKIRTILEGEGHAVVSADGGAEAMLRAEEAGSEVILIGLSTASDDGLRLCAHFRSQEHTRHVPIILVIEESDTPRLVKALDIGANDYLIKPVDRNELIARTRTQIRRWRYHQLLRESYANSLSQALTDGLTGLYNRRYLTRHLDMLVARAKELGKPLSVAMLDIDHFKQVNDAHGHAAGDEVIKTIAQRAVSNLRNFDTVARYGGEEFCVLMPDTLEADALMVAERLRERVAREPIAIAEAPGRLDATVSIGVAALAQTDDDGNALLKRADAALYRAKNSGRNRVAGGAPATAMARTG